MELAIFLVVLIDHYRILINGYCEGVLVVRPRQAGDLLLALFEVCVMQNSFVLEPTVDLVVSLTLDIAILEETVLGAMPASEKRAFQT